MTDIVSSLNVLYCSTLCIFIYIFGIWTNTAPVGMVSRVLEGMAREAQDLAETPSRNEQDTVNSVICHKKGSKTYRSLFPHVCFRFSQLGAQATETWEEEATKRCNLCSERRVPGGTGLHTARWGALGRAWKELFCRALPVCGVLPSLSLQSLPNSSCYFIQSLSWLVYKIKVL